MQSMPYSRIITCDCNSACLLTMQLLNLFSAILVKFSSLDTGSQWLLIAGN
jgi:hypothetical protein